LPSPVDFHPSRRFARDRPHVARELLMTFQSEVGEVAVDPHKDTIRRAARLPLAALLEALLATGAAPTRRVADTRAEQHAYTEHRAWLECHAAGDLLWGADQYR